MKKILFILIALFTAGAGKAQQVQSISKEERVNNLSKTLSVDKTRAEEIASALDYNIAKIRSTVRDTSLAPQVKRTLMKQLHEERQAKIKATLTPEQLGMLQAKIAQQQQAQRAKMEQHRQAQLQKLQEKGTMAGEKKEVKKP